MADTSPNADSSNPENPYQPPATTASDGEANALEGLEFTTAITSALNTMQSWIRFLSIMGFIGAGFLVLGGLGAGIAIGVSEVFAGVGLGLLYVILGVVYFFPALHLYNYSGSLKKALSDGTGEDLERAFDRARSFWKFVGILTVVGLAVGVLGVVVAMVVGIAQAFG